VETLSFFSDEQASQCVVHFSGYSSDVDREARVLFLPLDEVREHELGQVCNEWDIVYPPSSPDQMLARLREVLGTDFGGYSLMSNNCEHFATWVRYGIKLCKQVDDVVAHGSLVAGLALAGTLVIPALAAGLMGALLQDSGDVNSPLLTSSEGEIDCDSATTRTCRATKESVSLIGDIHAHIKRGSSDFNFEPGSLQETGLATACVVGQLAELGVGLLGVGLSGLFDLGSHILSADNDCRSSKICKLSPTNEHV